MFSTFTNSTRHDFIAFQASDVRDTSDILHADLDGESTAFPKCVSLLIPQGWTATQIMFSQWSTSPNANDDYRVYGELAQAVEVVEVPLFVYNPGFHFDSTSVTRTTTTQNIDNIPKANVVLDLSADTNEFSILTGRNSSYATNRSFIIKIGSLTNSNSVPIYYQGGFVKVEEIA